MEPLQQQHGNNENKIALNQHLVILLILATWELMVDELI